MGSKYNKSEYKINNYECLNEKRVSSFDEYDPVTGKKVRTVNFVLYKSIDEYDLKTGKKIRTINFSAKDKSKITSIQYYDIETERLISIVLYKQDGRTISAIKKFDYSTNKVASINKQNYVIENPAICQTKIYDNIKPANKQDLDSIDNLINILYKNKVNFKNL